MLSIDELLKATLSILEREPGGKIDLSDGQSENARLLISRRFDPGLNVSDAR
jgi:hypothetical protein